MPSFQTAFESPHCTVKWTSHHLELPKGKKKCIILYVRPILFRQPLKLLTAMQSGLHIYLVISKGKKDAQKSANSV